MQLFDLLSLIYVFLGVRTVWTLARHWRAFTDAKLTAFDRQLASQIAFFVFIPIGVFLHELGHAAATYQFGGTIDWLGGGFHYALFYGYVIPQGRFTVLQDWWISLAGNLVSIVYGFIPLILLKFFDKPWLKFTLLAFARIQLGWSLVGYPLITFAGFEGDWQTIYFAIPILGGAVFIVQATLAVALWLFDRSARVKRWEFNLDGSVTEPLRELDAAIAARAHSVDPLIARGNFFVERNQVELAIADYRAALKLDAQNPRALFNLAQIRLLQKRFTDAEKYFRAALVRASVSSDRQLTARSHFGLGMALYHRGDARQAVREIGEAIARVPGVAGFHYWRGIAYRAINAKADSRADFTRALELAENTDPQLAAQAREMLST